MTATQPKTFMTSRWTRLLLGAGVLFLLGGGIFNTTSAQTVPAPYYIIDSNDSRYPQGCNTPGLSNPSAYCILQIGNTLVAPGATDTPQNKANAYNYCH